MGFKVLGKQVTRNTHTVAELDTFDCPEGVDFVSLESDEFTSLCPVTQQPDFGVVTVEYIPDRLCIESKSFKLYLWQFRDKGVFCEALSAKICADVYDSVSPEHVKVTVKQKPRGGVAIVAVSERSCV